MLAFNDNWEFVFVCTEAFMRGEGEGEKVRLPHTVRQLPPHYIDRGQYETRAGYRNTFMLTPEQAAERVFLQFDGAQHTLEVFVNGEPAGRHACGYTAARIEITDLIRPGENRVAVRLSTFEENIPPFGFAIDYLGYGGLCREVWLDIRPRVFISDVFVSTPDIGTVRAETRLEGGNAKKRLVLMDKAGRIVLTAEGEKDVFELSVPDAEPWEPDSPVLYTLAVSLPGTGDEKRVSFGFRMAEWKKDGFYLNGRRFFLRGLDRHQCFPYMGDAAPASLQREDARILKEELGCTCVRTSHYPQSQHFIDACDALGLLVITEIPGWQYIGDDAWKEQALVNTREMVLQYRNHPSIVLWGVRINESGDDDELYLKTNRIAHDLDPSRATGGIRCRVQSSFLEDVYTFNDFVHTGNNRGVRTRAEVSPDPEKPLIITEHNGHMFPTKSFDTWERRQEHAVRHANVQIAAAESGEHAGCLGWCFFDYPTHPDFGAGDRICYHGVSDRFRNPKTAAYLYASQQEKTPVLYCGCSMDIGDYNACDMGRIAVFTNADTVKAYANGEFVTELRQTKDSPFPHPPVFMTPEVYRPYLGNWGDGYASRWLLEGYRDEKLIAKETLSPAKDLRLHVLCSATELIDSETYDAAAVRIRIEDENGRVASYAQLPVFLQLRGVAELIGPSTVTAEGGMTGTYIRTTGEAGKAELTVIAEGLAPVTVSFTVRRTS